ncbi:hypothetical protein FBZ89_101347 [Nitrospirillum amazonense]|uniref:PH (Pleckstrin Homology) domain-containing protein n=1 Tax=Nitrospirillum amazonense TaxID=28077 RepID=A0A560FT33_9PROT|nr:PH domain-containing protein [Nitrospirillum amazonense]TWB24721.1 hypothetical protein FBZ89_101347 [Nitrospirillum amazonense]
MTVTDMLTPTIPFPALAMALEPSERLLWQGVPAQGPRLRKRDTLLIPFSLLWTGFAIFWEAGVTTTGAPLFFRLWGLPFVLFGLYFVIGRFFHDAYRRARTVYALTDQRILILSPKSRQSLELTSLGEIRLDLADDGSGSVAFGPEVSLFGRHDMGMTLWTGKPAVPTFELIPAAEQVYARVREAKRRARGD